MGGDQSRFHHRITGGHGTVGHHNCSRSPIQVLSLGELTGRLFCSFGGGFLRKTDSEATWGAQENCIGPQQYIP